MPSLIVTDSIGEMKSDESISSGESIILVKVGGIMENARPAEVQRG